MMYHFTKFNIICFTPWFKILLSVPANEF